MRQHFIYSSSWTKDEVPSSGITDAHHHSRFKLQTIRDRQLQSKAGPMTMTKQWQEKVLEHSLATSETPSIPANMPPPAGHPGLT